MLVATELKGELARIRPARGCCRRAELAGLLFARPPTSAEPAARIRTLDHATARVAVQLASAIGLPADGPMPAGRRPVGHRPAGRRHLQVVLDRSAADEWSWPAAKACDRRAFMRGALLTSSISLGGGGPHIEFVFADRPRAAEMLARLDLVGVHGRLLRRRGRWVAYLKGQEEVATLLRLTGANRALLDFEAGRVGREVRNQLNRQLNAEEANVDRTVQAADRQLQAIALLAAAGELERLPEGLRETAAQRRRQPDADLDALASSLGIGRSAVNHRLRRLIALASELGGERRRQMNAPRVPLVAGNWKMNPPSRSAAVLLAADVAAATEGLPVRTVVCPPTIFLEAVATGVGDATVDPGGIGIGAQTMRAEESGAYTGETSPLMVAGLAQYVILGHSERRLYDNETDAGVAAKVASAVSHGLVPIAAIGERAEERRQGSTTQVIERQLRAAISRLERLAGSGLVIAYEPVWAIGTGDAATGEDAQAVAAQIRAILHEADPDGAHEVPILYGGSCTPENAAEFFALPDIDGALVGGASLDAARFAAIVRIAAELRG